MVIKLEITKTIVTNENIDNSILGQINHSGMRS